MIAVFRVFADDETGKISSKNLKEFGQNRGMTDEELQEFMDVADRDGDGEISEEEFIRILWNTVSCHFYASP